MSEREDSLSQLRQQIDQATCGYCGPRGLPREQYPDLGWVHVVPTERLKAFGKPTFECTAKSDVIIPLLLSRQASIVKAAFEAAAQLCHDAKHVQGEHHALCTPDRIRALPPESAILGAQIAELEARLEEAKWWMQWAHWIGKTKSPAEDCDRRIADLESQLSALKAEREEGAKK